MRKDIITQENTYEPTILLGDFFAGESREQEADLIIYSARGDWKQNPLIGVGVRRAYNKPISEELSRQIRLQCESDSLRITNVIQGNEKITVR